MKRAPTQSAKPEVDKTLIDTSRMNVNKDWEGTQKLNLRR